MSKKLFWLTAVLAGVLIFPVGAAAHELLKDEVGDAGALMYISPEDDPIAGQQSTLFFEISDTSLSAETVTLTIAAERSTPVTVPVNIEGVNLSASYKFPGQGLYKIKLTINKGERAAHVFSKSQLVSRGDTKTGIAAKGAPLWAKVGIAVTTVGAVVVAAVTLARRRIISQYSKT